MALNFGTASPTLHLRPLISLNKRDLNNNNKQKHVLNLKQSDASPSSLRVAALSEETTQSRASEDELPTYSGTSSSARTQLDLLEQLTANGASIDAGYESDGGRGTIRDQLANLFRGRDDDFSIPLGKKNLKKVSASFLTVSQKRNIRRQAYLNEVSQRNDSVFFATIGAFVILPPIIILGVAIATGYVQLFP